MKPIPIVLAGAVVAAATQDHHVVTVTTYLPFEQHPCHEYFMLGGGNQVPDGACEPGACCVGVKDVTTYTDKDGNVVMEPTTPSGTDVASSSNAASGTGGNPVKPSSSFPTISPPVSRSTVITSVQTDGSVTRTYYSTIVNNRTITEELTEVITETVPETSRETIIVTTTSPDVETFTTTSDGSVIVETTTEEIPVVETETTNVVLSTTETITTPVVITTTEKITTSNTTVVSTITTTSIETLTTAVPESTVITETITTPTVITTAETTYEPEATVEPETELIPPPPDPTEDRDVPESCPTPTCGHGIEYALYDNPFVGDTSRTYDSFDPNYFKKTQPVHQQTLNAAIYISDHNNGNGFNPLFKNAAAGYRGYLFACKAGRYRFNSPYSDDITLMWFGAKAYDGYTRDNADIVQAYYGDNRPKNIYKELDAGTYYPIRVLWGNTGGASDLSLRIYGPDGEDLSGADQSGEYYVTTKACDGSYGPWAPWGEEP